MSFDAFHDCLYTNNMKELKNSVNEDRDLSNTPGIIQGMSDDNKLITASLALTVVLIAIVGVGAMAEQHGFQQDVKHNREIRTRLLDAASKKLNIPSADLQKMVEQQIKAHPELFTYARLKDIDNSSWENIKLWWNAPGARALRNKMGETFIPGLKAAITAYSKNQRSDVGVENYPGVDPRQVTGENWPGPNPTPEEISEWEAKKARQTAAQQAVEDNEKEALAAVESDPAYLGGKAGFRRQY